MMLPPTQQATATLVTSMVKSIVDDIEERRLKEEEKLKGEKPEDKVLKTLVTSDNVAGAANAKINEHFFGALRREENPFAVLVARFTAVMGVTQEPNESDVDFGTRLGDDLYFAGYVAKQYSNGKSIDIGLKTFAVTAKQLAATIDGTAEKPSNETQFLARFVVSNGLEQAADETDTDYENRMRTALTNARKTVPSSVEEIESKAGLTKLGITAEKLVEAIKQPYGDAAQQIKAVLDDQARDDKTWTVDVSKILQRLEEVADPKTIEELKADRQEKDPTKVEDAETRKEREETIRSLEAGDKLEDVQKLQDAVEKGNEAAVENGGAGGTTTGEDAGAVAIATIQVLAAGAEMAQTQAAVEAKGYSQSSDPTTTTEDAAKAGEAPTDDEQAIMLANVEQSDAQTREDDATKGILAVNVDENGIYELLARKKAA